MNVLGTLIGIWKSILSETSKNTEWMILVDRYLLPERPYFLMSYCVYIMAIYVCQFRSWQNIVGVVEVGITLPDLASDLARWAAKGSQGKLPCGGGVGGRYYDYKQHPHLTQIIMSPTQPIYINPAHFTLNTIYTNHTCHQKLFLAHIQMDKR